jgi:hypothetical protein
MADLDPIVDMHGALEAHRQFLVYMVGAIGSHKRRWGGGPNVANDAIKAEYRFVEYLLCSIDAQSRAIFKMIEEFKNDRLLIGVALNAFAKQQSCDRSKLHADFIETAARLHHGNDKILPH